MNTSYLGNTVTVTDQAGKNRKSETDALGRLKQVWENPTGLNYQTGYSYEVLDNLTTVAQGVQTHTFVYDSLKRLTSATNPESGMTTYQYDNNGNLTFKQDALNRMTWYLYDTLNRNQQSYTNDPNTPQVVSVYDTATLGKGKLGYSFTTSYWVGSTSWKYLTYNPITSYDALGRPSGLQQYYRDAADTTWGTAYTTSRTYDLASNVKSQTYPSGRVVNYSYNTANQLTGFTGNLGDGTTRTYVSNATYSPAGLKERESYGMTTPLHLKLHYNKRHQMVDLRLGTVNDEWNWNRGALIFYYGTNAINGWNPFADDTDNNGNVRRAVNYVPLDDAISNHVVPQLADYTYDNLNRIGSYNEAQYNGSSWTYNVSGQTFNYDRYGNRQITATLGGVNGYNPTYNTSNNRIVGLTYDAVGNITYDGWRTMTYDANNKLVSASSGTGSGGYVYNANGSRVIRTANGVTTWQIYGLEGELVAEYAANGAVGSPQKEYGYRSGQLLVVAEGSNVRWLVTDHLGSTRMTAEATGSLTGMKRQDYLPFGEDLYTGLRRNGGNGQYGYEPPASTVRQRFTGYERDVETGLDYAQARMYANWQGRFTSPDPLLSSAKSLQPQSWNRYSYCLNQPLKYIDPLGLIWGYKELDNNNRQYQWFDDEQALKDAGFSVYQYNYVINANGTGYYLSPNGPDWIQFESSQFTGEMWSSLVSTHAGNFSPEQQQALQKAVFNKIYALPEIERSRMIAGMVGGLAGGLAEGAGGIWASIRSLLSGLGGRGAATEVTVLYRAVGQAEFEQLMKTGAFQAGTNSLGGKFFAESLDDAIKWGELLEGKGAFKVIEARIPTVEAQKFMRWDRLDGIGPARYAELNQLRNATIRPVGSGQ